MSAPLTPLARRLLPLIDATALDPSLSPAALRAWCTRISGLPVRPAAICVRLPALTLCRESLADSPIRCAVVANFPLTPAGLSAQGSGTDAQAMAQEAKLAVQAGAHELDLLFPFLAFQEGREKEALACVRAVREAAPALRLKLILESGAFTDPAQLHSACLQAVEAGVDMLKTSSGYHAHGASVQAAEIFCAVSAAMGKMVGIKISGGIRTPAQASAYLDLIAARLGLGWGTAELLRFGASQLIDALCSPAEHSQPVAGGY